MKQKAEVEEYSYKVAGLTRLEHLASQGSIDLFYADESGVSLLPCVPYRWQFKDESVFSLCPARVAKGQIASLCLVGSVSAGFERLVSS